MIIRMIQSVKVTTPPALYKAGQQYDVEESVAKAWGKAGFCEYDKMVALAPEIKAAPKTAPKPAKKK